MKAVPFLALLLFSLPGLADSEWKATSKESQLNEVRSSSPKSSLKSDKDAPARILSLRPQHTDTGDFWIYDAWISLLSDPDADGYYSEFTLSFDVDSLYTQAPVYARLYLGNADKFREYHTTSVFSVHGESSDDFLDVTTTLLEGFRADDYEILIELYDGDTNELVAVYDSYDDEDLLYLPLESREYEQNVVIVEEVHGGSASMLAMLLLLTVVIWRSTTCRDNCHRHCA